MDTDPIIKHGSVTRRPGHLRIGVMSLTGYWSQSYRVIPELIIEYDSLSEITYSSRYKFCLVKGVYYYVDGRYRVWKTDINIPRNIVFDPVGKEFKGFNTCIIQFKKLHKLEVLFS